MQIHIAAPAMIGGQVEDDLNVPHGHPGDPRLPKIGLDKFHRAPGEMVLDILQFTAGEIIHDAHFRPALHQGVGEMGADKRGPAGD